MKTKLFFSIVLALSIISCNDGDDLASIVVEPTEVGTISLNISVRNIVDVSTSGKISSLDEVLDNLSVDIYDSTGATVIEDRYRSLPEFIELPVGAYTVVFYTPQDSIARFDEGLYGNEPQISFDVKRDANTTVPVVLRLFDVATTIDFSDELLQNFPDVNVKVTISLNGNDSSLDWSASDDIRTGYFSMIEYVSGGSGLYNVYTSDLVVEITATDTAGNPNVVSRTYPDAVANQHYELLIGYAENEMVNFDITLVDENIIEDEITFPDGNGSDGDVTSETTGTLVQGDLIVTEIMNNPDVVGDTKGEWFELYNTTSNKDISLNGLKIVGASNEFAIDSELTIAPGTYVVFGRNGDRTTNGGVIIDYVYSSFTLANSSGSITIMREDNEIDQVIYDNFPSEAGKSMQLNRNNLNFSENDAAANWCLATTALDQGDFGSPGIANETCN